MLHDIISSFQDLPADTTTIVMGVVAFWLMFVMAPLFRPSGRRRTHHEDSIRRCRLPARGGRG